jgi:glycosyltransferase involved in cell wall biosynthesis
MKKVLFLSGLDFKDKSIQVIRKTPEAYVKKGWHVDYIVARDNVEGGNYFYEDEINPSGVHVYRVYWPLLKLRALFSRPFDLLLSKVSSGLVVIKLIYKALKLIKENDYDVVYGYELQGVLAMNLLKPFLSKSTKKVSRFQGTFLNEMLINKQYLRLFFNLDLLLAIRSNSDLLIMTNDGTQGDKAVQKVKGTKPYRMEFWPNGVDSLPEQLVSPFEKPAGTTTFMSISRLVGWKKVERNIYLMSALKKLGVNDIKYYIIGDGDQKASLISLTNKLLLNDVVVFVGALKHKDVARYLVNADFFLSMYDSSNVGNPLLEAIRANKIIVTLSNGDTSDWVIHNDNGLIYEPDNIDYDKIAFDIKRVIDNPELKSSILENIKQTEESKLWTWEARLDKEIELVGNL